VSTNKNDTTGMEQLTLRVPTEIIERAKKGAQALSGGDNSIARGLPITYTALIRLAIAKGLPLVMQEGKRKTG
jgi:hypothetical protein